MVCLLENSIQVHKVQCTYEFSSLFCSGRSLQANPKRGVQVQQTSTCSPGTHGQASRPADGQVLNWAVTGKSMGEIASSYDKNFTTLS